MRTMRARYNGRCKHCRAHIEVGDTIRYSRATGALCANEQDCRDYQDAQAEQAAEMRMERAMDSRYAGQSREDFYRDEDYLRDAEAQQIRREEAEYQRGYHEVAQIQASAPAGSALREAMYLEMEMAAYNRGEEY